MNRKAHLIEFGAIGLPLSRLLSHVKITEWFQISISNLLCLYFSQHVFVCVSPFVTQSSTYCPPVPEHRGASPLLSRSLSLCLYLLILTLWETRPFLKASLCVRVRESEGGREERSEMLW